MYQCLFEYIHEILCVSTKYLNPVVFYYTKRDLGE